MTKQRDAKISENCEGDTFVARLRHELSVIVCMTNLDLLRAPSFFLNDPKESRKAAMLY